MRKGLLLNVILLNLYFDCPTCETKVSHVWDKRFPRVGNSNFLNKIS